MTKKTFLSLALVALIMFAASCGFLSNNLLKKQIFALVTQNEALLQGAVREIGKLGGDDIYISTKQKSSLYNDSDDLRPGLILGIDGQSKVINIENNILSETMALRGLQDISRDYKDSSINFYCGGRGLGSETSYYGFFYSADDDMTAIWCSGSPLTRKGKGWEYQQPDGDNSYYTEKIADHFYYYEAHF